MRYYIDYKYKNRAQLLGPCFYLPSQETNLAISYNLLNLQQSLSQSGTTVSTYTWLSDGTKCVVGGGETTQKETGTEVAASVNLKTGKLDAKTTKINDGEFKSVGEGTIGILTGTEKKGEDHKFTLGLTPELNLGVVGTGIGINFSAQGNHGPEEKKDNRSKK